MLRVNRYSSCAPGHRKRLIATFFFRLQHYCDVGVIFPLVSIMFQLLYQNRPEDTGSLFFFFFFYWNTSKLHVKLRHDQRICFLKRKRCTTSYVSYVFQFWFENLFIFFVFIFIFDVSGVECHTVVNWDLYLYPIVSQIIISAISSFMCWMFAVTHILHSHVYIRDSDYLLLTRSLNSNMSLHSA